MALRAYHVDWMDWHRLKCTVFTLCGVTHVARCTGAQIHMDRESKRMAKTRAVTIIGIALVHGLMIVWVLSIKVLTSATSTPAIQVEVVDKPPRSRAREKLSALQMHELKPVLAPMAVPHLDIPTEPPPRQALASEDTSESNVSVVASNGAPSVSSNGIGAASSGEGDDFTVAYRVQPIYSDASVRAREQGYVVVGLLIDEHGRVRKTTVGQSSGFSRLDQSAVDALRQWTFKRAAGAPRGPTWTTFRYGFHLASSNSLDLSAINLALLSYDPDLKEQIRQPPFRLLRATHQSHMAPPHCGGSSPVSRRRRRQLAKTSQVLWHQCSCW